MPGDSIVSYILARSGIGWSSGSRGGGRVLVMAGRGGVAAKSPKGLVVAFTVPLVLKGVFRRFCAVTSAVVIKRIMKIRTLTTMNTKS